MDKKDLYYKALFRMNTVYGVFGVVTAAIGIWFFVQVTELASLRNSNHYLVDHWLEGPWPLILLGSFTLFIANCGLWVAIKESRGILRIYWFFLIIMIVLQVTAATLILVLLDGVNTDNFVKDIVYDSFKEYQSNSDMLKSFGRMEQKLRCCGANNASDYRSSRNDLPLTCCLDSNQATCEFTDKEANERLGCAEMASLYAKNMMYVFVAVSFPIFLLGIIGLVLTWKLDVVICLEAHQDVVAEYVQQSE